MNLAIETLNLNVKIKVHLLLVKVLTIVERLKVLQVEIWLHLIWTTAHQTYWIF